MNDEQSAQPARTRPGWRARGVKRLAVAMVVGLVAVLGLATPAAASGTFMTLADLNLRECPVVDVCRVQTVIPAGTWIELGCWYPGTPINGDDVWYRTEYNGYMGMVSGYYMNTGADPNPNLYHCP